MSTLQTFLTFSMTHHVLLVQSWTLMAAARRLLMWAALSALGGLDLSNVDSTIPTLPVNCIAGPHRNSWLDYSTVQASLCDRCVSTLPASAILGRLHMTNQLFPLLVQSTGVLQGVSPVFVGLGVAAALL